MNELIEKLKILKEIEYGFIDKAGNVHDKSDNEYDQNYRLQSPNKLLKTKTGNCWDQVELTRELLKEYNPKTYFIVYYGDSSCPSHSFIAVNIDNKFIWIEKFFLNTKESILTIPR